MEQSGLVLHPRVYWARQSGIERGEMKAIRGIIVHQTGGSTAASTLASYTHVQGQTEPTFSSIATEAFNRQRRCFRKLGMWAN
jgi:hypothetical protein